MATPTPVLGLQAATAADLEPDYLVTDLGGSLLTLDELFSDVSGHDHSGPAQGGKLPSTLHEEFLPVDLATTVTLANTALAVLLVSRGGVIQSEVDLNYVLAVDTLTFATAFDGTERVVVLYSAVLP